MIDSFGWLELVAPSTMAEGDELETLQGTEHQITIQTDYFMFLRLN